MLMWVMSDRAIPRSFRFMEGFGVHTFRFVNAAGESTFVKFHWKPKQGLQSVVWNEAVKINGADPDFHRRDLWDAITTGRLPGVGARHPAVRRRVRRRVRRSTCSTPPSSSPRSWCRCGRSVAWCSTGWSTTSSPRPSRSRSARRTSCPGIDFTNDPLLQGRNFSYLDTQLKRLGSPNFTHLPVNAPKCPFAHFQQDGHMAMSNPVGRVNYEPNSWPATTRGPREDPASGFTSFPEPEGGDKRRLRPESFADHYSQARQFYVSQTPIEQQHIADAFVFELSKVERARHPRADGRQPAQRRRGPRRDDRRRARARRAARRPRRAGGAPDHRPRAVAGAEHPRQRPGRRSPAASSASSSPTAPTPALLAALRKAAAAPRARWSRSSPRRSAASTLDDGTLIAGRPEDRRRTVGALRRRRRPRLDEAGGELLASEPAAKDFVADAHAHCKFIGYTPGARRCSTRPASPSSTTDVSHWNVCVMPRPSWKHVAAL